MSIGRWVSVLVLLSVAVRARMSMSMSTEAVLDECLCEYRVLYSMVIAYYREWDGIRKYSIVVKSS